MTKRGPRRRGGRRWRCSRTRWCAARGLSPPDIPRSIAQVDPLALGSPRSSRSKAASPASHRRCGWRARCRAGSGTADAERPAEASATASVRTHRRRSGAVDPAARGRRLLIRSAIALQRVNQDRSAVSLRRASRCPSKPIPIRPRSEQSTASATPPCRYPA